MTQKKHTIESISLIKIEKSFRKDKSDRYYYNLKLSGIEEFLLLETEYKLDNMIVGKKVSYALDDDNVVINLLFY
jgi:hypothetical protein